MRFTLEAPRELARFIAPKGSVALDGTSLTVNGVEGTRFDVLLIHHSLTVTTWGERQVGDGSTSRSTPWRAMPRAWRRRRRRGCERDWHSRHSAHAALAVTRRFGLSHRASPETVMAGTSDHGKAFIRPRTKAHLLIIEARFHDDLADALLDGAKAALDEAGATYDVVTVPGALEIPAVIAFALDGAENGGTDYDGFVALGTVIRGDTYHFDIVANESVARPDGSCRSTNRWPSATAS